MVRKKRKIKHGLRSAFQSCKSLKSILVKTKSLTLKNVGSKAFQGTASDATVLVPKGKEKEYEEILKKRGADKKVKIKS